MLELKSQTPIPFEERIAEDTHHHIDVAPQILKDVIRDLARIFERDQLERKTRTALLYLIPMIDQIGGWHHEQCSSAYDLDCALLKVHS